MGSARVMCCFSQRCQRAPEAVESLPGQGSGCPQGGQIILGHEALVPGKEWGLKGQKQCSGEGVNWDLFI